MAQLLQYALIITGLLLLPPWLALARAPNPTRGLVAVAGAHVDVERDVDYLLNHVIAIAYSNLPFRAALCLCASAYFERRAKQTVAVLVVRLPARARHPRVARPRPTARHRRRSR